MATSILAPKYYGLYLKCINRANLYIVLHTIRISSTINFSHKFSSIFLIYSNIISTHQRGEEEARVQDEGGGRLPLYPQVKHVLMLCIWIFLSILKYI